MGSTTQNEALINIKIWFELPKIFAIIINIYAVEPEKSATLFSLFYTFEPTNRHFIL